MTSIFMVEAVSENEYDGENTAYNIRAFFKKEDAENFVSAVNDIISEYNEKLESYRVDYWNSIMFSDVGRTVSEAYKILNQNIMVARNDMINKAALNIDFADIKYYEECSFLINEYTIS